MTGLEIDSKKEGCRFGQPSFVLLYPRALRLNRLMESTRNNISLLFGSQLDEVHCVPGHTDGKLRIILGMLLSIQ